MQAGTQTSKGSIFVLDMGEPVRIMDIAQRMIELSGKSVDIIYTGLRPGEKLHEALYSADANLMESDHDLIWRLASSVKDPEELLTLEESFGSSPVPTE
jgi:FlaA1/EpsC-like NDP-sugar epimerase